MKKPQTRKAARTIIFDENDRTAILSVRNGDYYKVPGGGIEPGQTVRQAAKAEAKQEAGCDVKLIMKIGEHSFVDPKTKKIHHSVFYLAQKIGDYCETSFDEFEKENDFKLHWLSIEEAIRLFRSASPSEEFGREINQRDLAFLIKAKEIWFKNKPIC